MTSILPISSDANANENDSHLDWGMVVLMKMRMRMILIQPKGGVGGGAVRSFSRSDISVANYLFASTKLRDSFGFTPCGSLPQS